MCCAYVCGSPVMDSESNVITGIRLHHLCSRPRLQTTVAPTISLNNSLVRLRRTRDRHARDECQVAAPTRPGRSNPVEPRARPCQDLCTAHPRSGRKAALVRAPQHQAWQPIPHADHNVDSARGQCTVASDARAHRGSALNHSENALYTHVQMAFEEARRLCSL